MMDSENKNADLAKLTSADFNGGPDRVRTCDLQIRSACVKNKLSPNNYSALGQIPTDFLSENHANLAEKYLIISNIVFSVCSAFVPHQVSYSDSEKNSEQKNPRAARSSKNNFGGGVRATAGVDASTNVQSKRRKGGSDEE